MLSLIAAVLAVAGVLAAVSHATLALRAAHWPAGPAAAVPPAAVPGRRPAADNPPRRTGRHSLTQPARDSEPWRAMALRLGVSPSARRDLAPA
jgi:hypothetical protein